MEPQPILPQGGYPVWEVPPESYLNDPEYPPFWVAARRQAYQEFLSLPFPSGKDERWRFTSLHKIGLERFFVVDKPEQEAALQLRKEYQARKDNRWKLVHWGEEPLWRWPEPGQSSQVVFCPLLEAAQKFPQLVQPFFFREKTRLGGEKFAALTRLWCRNGCFLYVGERTTLADPLEIEIFSPHSPRAIFPYILIVVERCASARVRIRLRGTEPEGGPAFCSLIQDQFVGSGGELRVSVLQDWPLGTVSLQMGSTVVDRDGRAITLHANLGASYARLENHSKLVGPGAQSLMLSATLARDGQEFDQRTFQEHVAGHTTSDLLYKNALADRSRTIFAGMIDVDPQAQATDAYQSNRNLLLSEEAEANTLPGLEIMANEVRCTHGATVGPLDPEELFYLRQRGIPLPLAKVLLVRGFLEEVLGRFGDGELTEEFLTLVEERLAQSQHPAKG